MGQLVIDYWPRGGIVCSPMTEPNIDLKINTPDFAPTTIYGGGISGIRMAWPTVFIYRWTNGKGDLLETPLPPEPYPAPKRMPSGVDALRPPYSVLILRPEIYDLLRQNGWLQDERHTGRNAADIIDQRKAPGA